MNGKRNIFDPKDPIANFNANWPEHIPPINGTMAAFRKVSEARAHVLRAQIDYEDAMRRLFEAEAELEFTKHISRNN